MLRPEVIEQLFDLVDETSMIISSELKMNYLHAMCESCQNIMSQEINLSLNDFKIALCEVRGVRVYARGN